MKNKIVPEETYSGLVTKAVKIKLNTGEIYKGILMNNSPLQISVDVHKPADGISTKRNTAYTVHIAKKGIVSISGDE